jgi:hypothetical protein
MPLSLDKVNVDLPRLWTFGKSATRLHSRRPSNPTVWPPSVGPGGAVRLASLPAACALGCSNCRKIAVTLVDRVLSVIACLQQLSLLNLLKALFFAQVNYFPVAMTLALRDRAAPFSGLSILLQ